MASRSPSHQEEVVESGSKTDSNFELTDKQWELVEDLFPWEPPGVEGGRPTVKPRECLEGILWVLRTGARWKDLPKHFPSKSTCHLRFKEWTERGIIDHVYRRLLLMLDEEGKIDCSETFGDGTFSSAKKGVIRSGRLVGAREPRSCCWSTQVEFRFRSTSNRQTSTKFS